MAKVSKKKPFRERMDHLSTLVEELESGTLDLEAAIARFEEGQKLHGELLKELGSYEKRLEVLVKDSQGEDRKVPLPGFDDEDE